MPERAAFLGASTDAVAKLFPDCGEQLKTRRASPLSSRSYCGDCTTQFRAARFLIIAGFALCLIIGYAVGHYNAPRKPFYLIGTPIDPAKNDNEENRAGATPDANRSFARGGQSPATSTEPTGAICGAPTKSGKPCRRKVAGGGYCWQHRDKYGQKKPPAAQ